MFNNKNIKFFLRSSSKKSNTIPDETSSIAVSNVDVAEDLYRKAIESKINELQQTPDEKKIEKHIQQRIQQCKLILDQLSKPEKVVSEIALSKVENNIIEAPAVQTDIDKNSQEKSSTLLQSIREKKLKSLQLQSKTEETNPATLNSLGNDPRKFAMNKNILSSVKLKQSVTTKYVSSTNDNRISPELAAILIRQRTFLEKEVVNTDRKTHEIDLVKSNEVYSNSEEEDFFDFFEKVCNAEEFSNNEFKIPSRTRSFRNALSRIYEDTTPQNSAINELDELLKTLQDFINEPDNRDKPVVVEMIPKLNFK